MDTSTISYILHWHWFTLVAAATPTPKGSTGIAEPTSHDLESRDELHHNLEP